MNCYRVKRHFAKKTTEQGLDCYELEGIEKQQLIDYLKEKAILFSQCSLVNKDSWCIMDNPEIFFNDSLPTFFSNMLEYKCKDANRSFVKTDRFYPSSKICYCCCYKNDKLTLKDRTWICPSCHSELDRDLNASKNILKEGLNLLNRRAYGDSLCKLGTSVTEQCSVTSSIEKECE